MRNLLRVEDLLMFGLGIYLFSGLPYAWWWFPLLLLTPDLGMLGYLVGNPWGAFTYNLTHHKGLAVALFVVGAYAGAPLLQLAGTIMFAHSSLDRVFGYGLKHSDSFHHTHLGWLGGAAPVDN